MKKILALSLVLTLVFALTACGSSSQTEPASNPEPAQTEAQVDTSSAEGSTDEGAAEEPNREELIKQYVGRYLMTELVDGNGTVYQQHWEDKSIYMYIEIKDDFSYTEKMVQNGSVTVVTTAYLDPIDLTVHNVDTFTDGKGQPLDLKDGVITIESSKGSRGVYELSNEVPDDPVPEG